MTSPSSAPTTAGRPSSSTSLRGHETDDPDAPRSVDDAGRRPGRGRDHRPRLGHDGAGEIPTGDVRGFERIGVEPGFDGIVGQQEPRRLERLAHPARGVQAGREGERDRLEIDGGRVDPGALQQRRDAGAWMVPKPLDAEPRDRPVLADDRRDVGDGADRGQVRQLERRLGTAGQVGQQQLGDLERDAAAGEATVGVGRRRPGAG